MKILVCCLFITPRGDQPRGNNEKDNKKREEDLAFLIGPRIDGIVQTKDGILLTLQDNPPLTHRTTTKVPKQGTESRLNEKLPVREGPSQNQWTSHLMKIQRRNLRMKYKIKTKLRAKLMREIGEKVKWTSPIIKALKRPNHDISTLQLSTMRSRKDTISGVLKMLRLRKGS